jgi:hypothetical protein
MKRLFLAAPLAIAALATAAGASAAGHAAKDAQTLSLYSLATEEQFVNNADDRQRGRGNNPFGNYKDLTATSKENGNGPFPGDQALFKFAVYSSNALKKSVGTAVFTCTYNFDRNAFCDAVYTLKGGSLIGAGAFNFDAGRFSIAITGGTGKYRSANGDLQATPAKNKAQHLTIVLTR